MVKVWKSLTDNRMDKLKYIKLENEDGSYSSSIPLAVDSNHVDVGGITLTESLNGKAAKSTVDSLSNAISSLASGSPAGIYTTVSELTTEDPDHSRIYIVSENGHWYFYNDGWEDGGVYQSTTISDNSIIPTKMTFIKTDTYYNMFDGNYLDGSISSNNLDQVVLNTGSYVTSHPGQFNMAIVAIEPGHTYSIKISNPASWVFVATNDTNTLVNGTILKRKVLAQDTSFPYLFIFEAQENENYVYIQTSNSGQYKFLQVVEGEETEWRASEYKYYLKGLSWTGQDIAENNNLIQSCMPLPAFGISNTEPKIEYTTSTHTLKNYYNFNIVLGRNSEYGLALTIPPFEKTLDSFQMIVVNRENLKSIPGATKVLTAEDLIVKTYYSTDNGYKPNEEILLFWCSLGTKIKNSIGIDVNLITPTEKKSILYLGDSILSLTQIPSKIANLTNTIAYDCTIPGSVLDSQTAGNINYEKLGFKYISQAIEEGDFSVQVAAAAALGSETMINHINILKDLDFSKIDAIVCEYGANDFTHGVVTLEHYKQVMKESIGRIVTAYPNIQFYFISPIYRTASPTTNPQGKKLIDYVEAEAEVCNDVNIPYFDFYHNGNINEFNSTYYLANDGLHPSAKGSILLADKISKFIISN